MSNRDLTAQSVTFRADSSVQIVQIIDLVQFNALKPAIQKLIAPYRSVLCDDATPVRGAEKQIAHVMENLQTTIPYVWLALEGGSLAHTGVSLTDVVIGETAWLHGVSSNDLTSVSCGYSSTFRRWVIAKTVLAAMTTAFDVLGCQILHASFAETNRGAKGFCLRMGFKKQGTQYQDFMQDGKHQNSLLYTLSRSHFRSYTKPLLEKIISKFDSSTEIHPQ